MFITKANAKENLGELIAFPLRKRKEKKIPRFSFAIGSVRMEGIQRFLHNSAQVLGFPAGDFGKKQRTETRKKKVQKPTRIHKNQPLCTDTCHGPVDYTPVSMHTIRVGLFRVRSNISTFSFCGCSPFPRFVKRRTCYKPQIRQAQSTRTAKFDPRTLSRKCSRKCTRECTRRCPRKCPRKLRFFCIEHTRGSHEDSHESAHGKFFQCSREIFQCSRKCTRK